jgi:hypothetical protein
MKSLQNAVITLALILVATTQSWAQEGGVTVQGMLASAKYAGACGILDSLVHFQKTTKMDGGDEFVARFWTVEAARLGLTVQQLSDRCNEAITAYGKFWDIAGEADE